MDQVGRHGVAGGVAMTFPCVDSDHFGVDDDGAIYPQPWMQWRNVGSVAAASKSGSYGVTTSSSSSGGGGGGTAIFGDLGGLFGGLFDSLPDLFGGATSILGGASSGDSAAGNKNDLLHSLQLSWTNTSPIDQQVYGMITRGGGRVALQARSRGGLVCSSGYQQHVSDPGPLAVASMLAVGADMARGGTLATGTTFCVIEARQNSLTFPLAPERCGWWQLPPGETLTAKVELRFVSEFWENTTIDGGDSGSESGYETGDTRLDLFAVPVI